MRRPVRARRTAKRPTLVYQVRRHRRESPVQCPSCAAPSSIVAISLCSDGTSLRRRRLCSACDTLFTTIEISTLVATQRPGVREPFSRQTVIALVRAAAQRQVKVADASAGRTRASKPPPGTSLVSRLPERRSTEASMYGAKSPYSLVPASGRG
ncbi:hypothetical protein ACFYRC_11215 [Streptomyces sp. NPDC005279]|uniref:NrdR family transcriptional regulator n=1 Tax=Streptomyces sp. NPDC005279 TaxID=3364712 RepID=UPI00368030DF